MQSLRTGGQATGLLGIVLGVIALVVAFIPCIGVLAFLLGIPAVILSIISLMQSSYGRGPRGVGIAALVVSLGSILLAALWLLIIGGGVLVAGRAIQELTRPERYRPGIEYHADPALPEQDTVPLPHAQPQVETKEL